MVVNGFVNVVITTIERRFGLRSSQTGLIAGGYDIASFLLLVPVSYLGGRSKASKPRLVYAASTSDSSFHSGSIVLRININTYISFTSAIVININISARRADVDLHPFPSLIDDSKSPSPSSFVRCCRYAIVSIESEKISVSIGRLDPDACWKSGRFRSITRSQVHRRWRSSLRFRKFTLRVASLSGRSLQRWSTIGKRMSKGEQRVHHAFGKLPTFFLRLDRTMLTTLESLKRSGIVQWY